MRKFTEFPKEEVRQGFYEYIKQERDNVDCGVLGKSILNSDIAYYRIGRGKRNIISVGAHHGMEHISSAVLFNVIEKMADNLARGVSAYGINLAFLLQKFTFWFIPCLNPDGVDMQISGLKESPLYERQIRMNGGTDFSKWQANARGVDLNHNYDYGFAEYKELERKEGIVAGKTRYSGEYPESEPETRALSGLIKAIAPELILTFHTQGEVIYPRPRSNKRVMHIAKRCAELLDYEISAPEGLSDFGGLSDYAGEALGIISLTVELGKGENPLPYTALSALAERAYKLHCVLPTKL